MSAANRYSTELSMPAYSTKRESPERGATGLCRDNYGKKGILGEIRSPKPIKLWRSVWVPINKKPRDKAGLSLGPDLRVIENPILSDSPFEVVADGGDQQPRSLVMFKIDEEASAGVADLDSPLRLPRPPGTPFICLRVITKLR
jgi:hypothetical protein